MIEDLRKIAYAVRDALNSSERREWSEGEGMGADGTPTMRIDKIAEDTVISVLNSMGNPYNILSEERGFMDFGRDMTLIMDPIDGTYNAIRSIPFYSISLALSTGGLSEISHALILNIPAGEEFIAEKGKGAWRNGEKIKTRKFSMEDSIFSVMLGRRAHPDSYRIAKIPKRVRSLGSASLDMAYVASGAMDMYYYRGRDGGLRIVDIAASTLILREAGGEVYNHELIPLNMEPDVRKRSSVIAVGDRRVLEVLK